MRSDTPSLPSVSRPTAASPDAPSLGPAEIQALLVYTDPLCCFTLDVVAERETSASAVARRVADRLDVSVAKAEEVLDGLVSIGYVDRTGLGRVAAVSLERQCDGIDAAVAGLGRLRELGDELQACDEAGAIGAAWDARSLDPDKRRAAAAFSASLAGRRHAARLADGTLGVPDPAETEAVPLRARRRQAAAVLTRPAFIVILERLTDGAAPRGELDECCADALGMGSGHVAAALAALVDIGWITRSSGGKRRYRRVEVDFFRARNQDAHDLCDHLDEVGDALQADTIRAALDSAWDARSVDPVRRDSARRFIHGPLGRVFQGLVAADLLGVPFAAGPGEEPEGAACSEARDAREM